MASVHVYLLKDKYPDLEGLRYIFMVFPYLILCFDENAL